MYLPADGQVDPHAPFAVVVTGDEQCEFPIGERANHVHHAVVVGMHVVQFEPYALHCVRRIQLRPVAHVCVCARARVCTPHGQHPLVSILERLLMYHERLAQCGRLFVDELLLLAQSMCGCVYFIIARAAYSFSMNMM